MDSIIKTPGVAATVTAAQLLGGQPTTATDAPAPAFEVAVPASPALVAGAKGPSKLDLFLAQQNVAPVTPIAPGAAEALTAGKGFETLRDEALKLTKDKNALGDAQKVADGIDFSKLLAISESGVEIQHAVTQIDKALVDRARNDKTGAVGQIIRDIQSNIAKFDRTLAMPKAEEHGFFEGVGKFFHKGAEAAVDIKDAAVQVVSDYWARYQPVSHQIEDLIVKLQQTRTAIIADEAGVALAQEASLESVDKYTIHAAGLIMALEKLQKEVLPAMIAEAAANKSDVGLAQRVQQYRAAETGLDKRIREIFEQRTFAEQQVASAGMMRVSGAQAAERLLKVSENIVPLFYRLAYQEVVLFKQREGLKLSEEITVGFDAMMRQSAKNLGQAYIEAAKANSAELIKSESLIETAEVLASALNEANEIAHADRANNVHAEANMAQARETLNTALVGINLPGPETKPLRDRS